MKIRHVWLLPPLDVGESLQGYVLTWRQVPSRVSPPRWDAYVVYVDRTEQTRTEWIPSLYLVPVESERPA